MERKCDSCKHLSIVSFSGEFCMNRTIVRIGARRGTFRLNLEPARGICNKEGDGIFVYFKEAKETEGPRL